MRADIERRAFLAGLSSAAAASVWPRVTCAQQVMPVIGFLRSSSTIDWALNVAAIRSGLKELGYVEGENMAFEFRVGEGRDELLPSLAADLVRRQVAVIVTGGPNAPLAAKAATATIPIVFNTGIDPVRFGLVASLSRPGGNVTGVSFLNAATEAKRLGLLLDLVPKATLIAMLRNPSRPDAADQLKDVQDAARTIGKKILLLDATTGGEIDNAFDTLVRQRVDALTIAADPFLSSRRQQIIALAERHKLPVMYSLRDIAAAGGLISYSASLMDSYRQVGVYAGRILKGAKPADLPVMLASKFDLVINLKTARALGLTIPPGLLAIADEVIE